MKRLTSILLGAVLLFSLCACGKDMIENPTLPSGYTEYSVRETNGKKSEGYGTQIDSHMFFPYNSLTPEEEKMFEDRIVEMNVQCIRTQVFPEWYERGNDNDDYNTFNYESANVDMNSLEMRYLYKVLDLCEKHGIKVDLSFYGCNTIYKSQDGKISGSWLGAPFTKHWVTAPKQVDENGNAFPGNEEYAETVFALLNYLLETKKYTCLQEFSIYPEPNLSFVTADGSLSYSGFAKLCKTVDARLKKEGIRNRIQFSGPASAESRATGFVKYIDDLCDVFDKFTVSTYQYNDTDSNQTLLDFGEAVSFLTDEKNKIVGIVEFGTNRHIDPANQEDIDTYGRALFIARYMICMTNTGFTNLKYWVLGDVMYGGFLMRLGLWKFRNFEWEARPQYYTWSMITKYCEYGSEIYPIESKDADVCACAFRLPDGNWTYIAVNSGQSSKKASFVNYNEGYPKTMKAFELTESMLGEEFVKEVKPLQNYTEVAVQEGCINYHMKPNSFLVLTTK